MSTPKHLAWLFWGLAALYYAYENFLQISLGVISEDLMHDFAITAHHLGLLTSVYFACYSFLQIPVGLLLDHLGTKRPLVIAVLLCAGSAFLLSLTKTLPMVFIARGLMGAVSAFAALSCLNMAARHFPATRFAMLTGLTLTTGMLGEMVAEAPLAYMTAHAPWRTVMAMIALAGLLIGVLLAIILPKDKPTSKEAQDTSCTHILAELKMIIKQPKSWMISLYGMLMFTPFLMLLQGSGIGYLQIALSTSLSDASKILTMVLIGFAIGGPILGWFADHFQRRKPVLTISAIGLLASTGCLILALPHNSLLCHTLFFCIGFTCSGFLPAFSVMKEISSPTLRATALGFMNTLNMFGAIFVAPIVGQLLDMLWDQHTLSELGTPLYSLHAYHIALSALPIMALLACLFLPWIPETYGKNTHQSSGVKP